MSTKFLGYSTIVTVMITIGFCFFDVTWQSKNGDLKVGAENGLFITKFSSVSSGTNTITEPVTQPLNVSGFNAVKRDFKMPDLKPIWSTVNGEINSSTTRVFGFPVFYVAALMGTFLVWRSLNVKD